MTVALRGTIPAHLWALAGLGMLLGAFAVGSAAIRAVAASPTMRIVSVGRGPSVLAVASRTGRVFVGNHDDHGVALGPDRVRILLDKLRQWLPWLSPLSTPVGWALAHRIPRS
jgi:hypothetical protein